MSWTDERVEKLKELWGEGMSASQIAKALGGVTRNAVIGKVHRLGLSNRGSGGTAPAEEKPAKPAKASRSKAAAQPKEAAPAPEEPKPAPVMRTPPVIRDASQPRAPGLPTPEEQAARATLAEIEKMAKKLDLLVADRADLQMADRRPDRGELPFLRAPVGGGQALLRAPCRGGIPAHVDPARPGPGGAVS